jgi:hypothetical protein
MPWKCSHVVQTRSRTSRVQVGTEVRLSRRRGPFVRDESDRNCQPDIIVHNAGRRTHVANVTCAHQGKISGLCWADDHRVLSCGVDRNIKMWDMCLEVPSDSLGAGPSQVRSILFCLGAFAELHVAAKTTSSFSRERNASVSSYTQHTYCCC